MKKIFLFVIISILIAGIVFAADKPDIAANVKTVQEQKNVQEQSTIAAKQAQVVKESQGISDCMQGLLKKQPNILREKAQAICNYRLHQKLTVANKLEALKTADISKFTELQKGKLESAIEDCKTEECKTKINERLQKVEKLTVKEQEKLQALEQIRLNKVQNLAVLNVKPEFSIYAQNKEFKARVIEKKMLVTANTDFLKAKESLLQSLKDYKEAKLRFQEIKKKLAECKDKETDECIKLREEIITRAKEQLINSTNSILEHLNKLKSKIESNEYVDSDEASDMLTKIQETITAVEELKNKIQVATTKEEITEAAKELKELWAKSKVRLKEHAARTVNARIGGIIVKSKQLEVKLENVLARMTEKGINTTSIQQMVDEFDALIEKARSNYELAVGKFKEAKAKETPDAALIQEAQKYMKDAHSSLKDAQQKLREMISSIKDQGGDEELTETELEPAEETEGGE